MATYQDFYLGGQPQTGEDASRQATKELYGSEGVPSATVGGVIQEERNLAKQKAIRDNAYVLQQQYGYTPDEAKVLSQKQFDVSEEAKRVSFQNDLLKAEDAKKQLADHRRDLESKATLNAFANDLQSIDTRDQMNFVKKVEQLHLKYGDWLSSSNPEAKQAQSMINLHIAENKNKADFYNKTAAKYSGGELAGIDESMINPQTGIPDNNLILQQSSKAYQNKLKRTSELAQIAEKAKIATYEREQKVKSAEKKMREEGDPLYQARVKLLQQQTKQSYENTLKTTLANEFTKAGLTRETIPYVSMAPVAEGDERGKKMEKGMGTHYIFKDKKGKPVVLSKESIDYARQALQQYQETAKNLDALVSGESASPSGMESGTTPKVMVYDPATGTLNPSE